MIAVTPITVQHTARVASLRAILNATEAVDSYCVDYLTDGGIVDLEALGYERVDHVRRTVAELDAIVAASDEIAAQNMLTADQHLFAVTVNRARALAAAIREAMAHLAAADNTDEQGDEIDEDTVQTAPPFAPKPAFEHTGFEAGAL